MPQSRPESESTTWQRSPRRSRGERRGKNTDCSNPGSHHEKIVSHGSKADGVSASSDEPTHASSTSTKSSGTNARLPNSATVGKPESMASVPVLNKKQETNPNKIRMCSWNIRRGLIIRETELKLMISSYKLNIIFLVETDTSAINVETDYKIPGFKTVIQNKPSRESLTRIICLIDEELQNMTKIRMDLTSVGFPSLWVEFENPTGKNVVCGGFYREWAPRGNKAVQAQVEAIQLFTNQIETAASEGKTMVVLGDANLCCERWSSPMFQYKRVAEELQDTLTHCGLELCNLGTTYTADRLDVDNNEITSALDHIYITSVDKTKLTTEKLPISATDHSPIMATFHQPRETKQRPNQGTSIRRRCMRDFTKTRWVDALRNQEWVEVVSEQDLETKTAKLTEKLTAALDECAPYKTVKVRTNFKPGITEEAKRLMSERDKTRLSVSKASQEDKPALKAKYRQLRNRVVNQIRKDTLQRNGDRLDKARNEGETWKIVNEIIKPRTPSTITIGTPAGDITNEGEVAAAFNAYFIEKINALKTGIDPSLVRDPLVRISEKLKDKNLKFDIKPVSVNTVTKIMRKMSKKKSSGKDGISQECLLLGLDVLATPLTAIINHSINTGTFPSQWKEAVVIPIHKKGDSKDPKNYRPVSCLAAASKVLEKVVCNQLTRFIEIHKLLPNNQHGFRQGRSTMTALSAMQKEWVANTEDGLMTGVLVWDLSSAFDTLDIELFLKKLSLYGADSMTSDWFRSFLTGRTQRVKIGNSLSTPLELTSGVPQGGILSPIIFTLYTADMELWLKTSSLFNFADDTTTDNKSKCKNEIRTGLEEDALNVLGFMASNGLVANQAKTEFLLLNEKRSDSDTLSEIKVGDTIIKRTTHTKLLGVQIEESQEWGEHLKSLITSLNQRLFMIRRVSRQLPKNKLMSVVHSLWISKLRYGLQLCTTVQLNSEEGKTQTMRVLQLAQNRLLRLLGKVKLSQHVSIRSLLERFNLLSVNQLSAEIKLTEVWKTVHVENSPMNLEPFKPTSNNNTNNHQLRPTKTRVFNDIARLKMSKSSFNIDSARIWNRAPEEIKCATTLGIAKKAIKIFCKTLPI
jgi:hypothetical protein